MTKIRLTKNLEPIRASALARLDDEMNARLHDLVASPVALIRARKLAEAKRLLTDEGGTPLLTAEAAAIGIDPTALASVVIAKAGAEAVELAEIEATRQTTQAAIQAARHPAEIEAAIADLSQTKGQ